MSIDLDDKVSSFLFHFPLSTMNNEIKILFERILKRKEANYGDEKADNFFLKIRLCWSNLLIKFGNYKKIENIETIFFSIFSQALFF